MPIGRITVIRPSVRTVCVTVATLAALVPGALPGQRSAPGGASSSPSGTSAAIAPVLDAAVRARVLDSISATLTRRYVDVDTAALIHDLLRRQRKARVYDTVTSPLRLAELVTRDLRAINGDLHLSLRFDPSAAAAPTAGFGGAAPTRPGGGENPAVARARRENFGITRVEVLPGNIGYLEVSGFQGIAGSEEAIANALRLLARTDAMIIDVRRNPGGSSGMSHLLFSHFLGAEPVPTIVVWNRAFGEPRFQKSIAEVPGPRRPDVPLFVLTSRGTGSAAEEFSFVLKNLKRATIVGDRTAGAGHMVNFFDVGDGFVLGASITRVTDPKSGKEWEAVGVKPDISVPAERALEAAQAAALKTIAKSSNDEEQRTLVTLLAETAEAKSRNDRPGGGQLKRFAATYDGNRVVSSRDGRLWYSRDGAPEEELIPVGGDHFALNGSLRVYFEGDAVPTLVIQRPEGTRLSYRRL